MNRPTKFRRLLLFTFYVIYKLMSKVSQCVLVGNELQRLALILFGFGNPLLIIFFDCVCVDIHKYICSFDKPAISVAIFITPRKVLYVTICLYQLI